MSPSPSSGASKPSTTPPARRLAWLRLAAFALALAAAFAVVALTIGHDRDALGSPPALAFIALIAALTCAFFPFPIMAAVAGVLYGTAEGTLICLTGGTIGALLAFGIARSAGAGPVAALADARLRRLLDRIGERGFSAVLLLRAFPGIPRDVVNYLCGLTPVRWRDFAAATALGTAPRAYAYTALGGSLGDLGNPQSIVAVSVLAAMALLGIWLFRRSGPGPLSASAASARESSPSCPGPSPRS